MKPEDEVAAEAGRTASEGMVGSATGKASPVDPVALENFFFEHQPDLTGRFTIDRVGGGQSCLTFSVKGDGWGVVLRRPPRGDLPKGAFDVTREFRVMKALADSGAPVPVPRPILLCEDTSVIGAPFYLMEEVDGVVVRAELPDQLSSLADRQLMSTQLIDTLVALHAVDYRAIGLEGYGKPEGYLKRQLDRMAKQWERTRFREIPEIEEAGAWLAEHIPPESPPRIVHGDYKLDNVILAPSSPARLIAVVDWELSTIADPLVDLGWFLYFWMEAGEESGTMVPTATYMEGFPKRAELLRRYLDATGANAEDIVWHVALGGWKIAIIMEASYKRYLGGVKDHPWFSVLEFTVPDLARRAKQAITGELSLGL